MLIRLRVKGFKSLEDVEVRFGPLTCVLGPNGAGKSNLFDAIHFLSQLADLPVSAAAHAIRGGSAQLSPLASLFTATKSRRAERMEFEADFLVDPQLGDDAGASVPPVATALRYALCLRYVPGDPGGIEVASESLLSIPHAEARQYLGFKASSAFIRSVFARGPARELLGAKGSDAAPAPLLRTALSTMSSVDHPTALAARREMQSWVVLRLEPSALRKSDERLAPDRMSGDGAHLPSTLERLNQSEALAYRLAALLPEVVSVVVDVDQQQRKAFHLETMDGRTIAATSASDGLLRLLGLAVVALDQRAGTVLCIEEPENGIHPASLDVIVDLFAQTVVDLAAAPGPENPLRQIIFNTHAPSIVQAMDADAVLIARTYQHDGAALSMFSPMVDSWRALSAGNSSSPVSFGALLAYLDAGDPRYLAAGHAPTLLQDYRVQQSQAAS